MSCGVSNASEIEELSIIKQLHLTIVDELKVDPSVISGEISFFNVYFLLGFNLYTNMCHIRSGIPLISISISSELDFLEFCSTLG